MQVDLPSVDAISYNVQVLPDSLSRARILVQVTIYRRLEMAISTNQNPTIYRNLYENTAPGRQVSSLIHCQCRMSSIFQRELFLKPYSCLVLT